MKSTLLFLIVNVMGSNFLLEFGLVVVLMHNSHVVHNCSAMCLRDLILAVIVPAVSNLAVINHRYHGMPAILCLDCKIACKFIFGIIIFHQG